MKPNEVLGIFLQKVAFKALTKQFEILTSFKTNEEQKAFLKGLEVVLSTMIEVAEEMGKVLEPESFPKVDPKDFT